MRANGRTIGSAASGATERANADTQALYEFFWNTYSNSLCPVTGGRGASASADFAANKPIATLDMRGTGAIGMDTMGNSAANIVAAATSAAVFGGAESTSITILQANLPDVTFPDSLTGEHHTHGSGSYAVGTSISNGTSVRRGGTSNTNIQLGGGGGVASDVTKDTTTSTLSLASGNVGGSSSSSGVTINGSVTSGGSNTAIVKSLMNPYRAGTWYFRL